MRAALLARVSSARQADEDRHSLPVQTERMRDFAEQRGWNIVRTFEIPGESAFTDDLAKRPQFGAAIEFAERGGCDVLIVYDITRFARDQYILHASLKRLRHANVGLYAVLTGIDYVAERQMAGIEGMMAEKQSLDQSWKIKHAKMRRHELGLPTGYVPFGYRRTEVLSPPEVVPEEAEAVRWAFQRRAEATGYKPIAEEFMRRGLRPRSRRYAGFTFSSVRSMIENDFYCGYVRHLGSRKRGAHEPIITEREWLDAQAAVKRTQRRHTRREPPLLAGIATCVHCGGNVWSMYSGKPGYEKATYRESSRLQLRECPSAGRHWRAWQPDEQVSEIMRSLGADEKWLARAAESARLHRPTVDVRAVRERLEGQRDRATKAYLAGALEEGAWRKALADIDAELRALPSQPDAAIRAAMQLKEFAEVWDIMTIELKREAVAIVMDNVLLDNGEKKLWVQPSAEYAGLFAHRVGDQMPRAGMGAILAPYSPNQLLRSA